MTDKQFIEKIVNHRKELGLTQKDISRITGLSQQAISSLERYDREPRLNTLLKYLEAININIENIFK